MNNDFYRDSFYKIKDLKESNGFTIEKNYSKRVKDEFLILKLSEKTKEYDIQILIWKKLFVKCHIFQVSGVCHNVKFKVFFKIEDSGFKLYDFSEKNCDIYEKNHKFLEIKPDNEKDRIIIYKDTKQLLQKFKKLLKYLL